MEAHSLLQRHGFDVSSYGTGAHVKLPGPSYREPNVYEFGTPYHNMYDDLLRKNPDLYKRNGILPMLKRNMSVNLAPQRWQDNVADGPFDVVLSFEDRVSYAIVDGYLLKEMVLALFSESDLCLSDDVVDQIVDKTFMESDKKGDGKIDLDEWKEFVDINPSLLNNMTLPYLKTHVSFFENETGRQSFDFPDISCLGVLPKYFSSEWSFAQFHLPEATRYTVAFGAQNTVIIIGLDGRLKELVEYDTHPPPGAYEETIRGRFKEAYRTAPLSILIDEIDAIASK
ncbi:uncharacterized protein A4U43_C03F19850 [Asparagus officinalis]|uniref:RNA polymerase II subunit A C-terminal domain phosphatase SSU72 n=1 Tax=Asparagus officinalis TaxID=4686 RepID=A0A5P1FGG8_ASPOF|nr:uncharacterized protein A4U43_C03F19850 [Asparagus officinalis]